MAISSRNTLLAALAFIAFQAQAVNVTVAYQTSAEPAKVAQADNTFAKESVDWRKFDSGASIVRAAGFRRCANRQPRFQPVSGCSQPTGAD
ncbi:taurine transporter subunit TauA [Escherichia coli]|uniref:Taurine transporter subunit TauA n=1 Tax=Escherichia coli TaxID=562 RepID=A0A376U497_ECOLX|nr:taurine transporter subunit TauA [Escherichia coli]